MLPENSASLTLKLLIGLSSTPPAVTPSSRQPPSYCVETRNRIRLAVAAYAYEVEDSPIMSDAEFDRLARSIRPTMTTGSARLDWFFLTQFDPSTGVWVHKHPDKAGLRRILAQLPA